ncbi:hypothetical protein [uncultured Gimesia sp.]|uniref:hypothetical protein n=1 Tax=uncultured Gimesia sp. TaxID=1678688 RepID=UPI0030D7DA4D
MTTAVYRSPQLLDQLRNQLRVMHYVWKTEQAYVMLAGGLAFVSTRGRSVACRLIQVAFLSREMGTLMRSFPLIVSFLKEL